MKIMTVFLVIDVRNSDMQARKHEMYIIKNKSPSFL